MGTVVRSHPCISQNDITKMRFPQFLLSTTVLSSAMILGQPLSAHGGPLPFAAMRPMGIGDVFRENAVSMLVSGIHGQVEVGGVPTVEQPEGTDTRSPFTFDPRDPLAKNKPTASYSLAKGTHLGEEPLVQSDTTSGVYIPEVAPKGPRASHVVDPETRFW